MIQEGPPRLFRVESVLRQDVGTGRRCGPCVDERRLDNPKFLRRSSDVASSFIVHERHSRVCLKFAGIIHKAFRQYSQNIAIDLDTSYVPLAKHQCRQNVSAAADADHEYRRGSSHIVGERSHVVLQMLERAEVSIEPRNDGGSIGIDIQIQLIKPAIRFERWTQSPPERSAVRFPYMDA